ncbi:MAG: hypothetical protein P8J87_13075 [Verrucomicrobiales bacterium]|nr:hypothetical protein [Verrucomicrobiales bacterium]
MKFEADNAFSVFPRLEMAIEASVALNAAVACENEKFPEDFAIRLSIGLDHGRILLLEGRDYFGDPVNTACKLGEDLARPGEILVPRTALETFAQQSGWNGAEVNFSISGIELEAVSIDY